MTTHDLTALRAAILVDPTDRVNWLVYADALEDVGDQRNELVRLMARPLETLSRDDYRRLKHLRGTVSLLSAKGRARIEATARVWSTGHRESCDVADIEDVLRKECHPLLVTWGTGGAVVRRLIVMQNPGSGGRWTWIGNYGQGGGGFPDRAEAILAAFSAMSAECLSQIRWIEGIWT